MRRPPVNVRNVALGSLLLAGLCTATLLAPLAMAQDQDVAEEADVDDSRTPPKEVSKRREAIDTELKQLHGHPWAAEYYYGDGLGANIRVSVAPQSGVAAVWTGCLGIYGSNEGRVREQPDGRLVFGFNKANKPKFGGFPNEVVPVRWGARRYLVPRDRMIDFVNEINHGDEPRAHAQGGFLLAMGDEAKPVTGLPALPDRYLRAIRHAPLEVNVVRVASKPDHRMGNGSYCEKKYRVTVDHGDADGLVPGVVLRGKTPGRAYGQLRIESATASQATGEISFFEGDCKRPESVPDRQWVFTTGAYGRRAQ